MNRVVIVGVFVALIAAFSRPAEAIVRRISAITESRVQSFVDGAADSMDEAFEEFGPDSGTSIPISTRAALESFEGSMAVSIGVAESEFDDPTRATPGRNPEELSLEANCASDNVDATSFEVESMVRESRIVRFSDDELGNPFDGTRLVRSAFFPSGAIFVWSADATRDLTGLGAELDIVVRRIALDADGAEGESEELLRLSASFQGGPGGSVNETVSPGITALAVDVNGLPLISGLPLGDISNLAVAQTLVIPDGQSTSYEYVAAVDVEFVIEAEVTARVSNLPEGTGVVAVFGRSFANATEVIEIGVTPDSAKAIEARLNKAIMTFSSTGAETGGISLPGVCGAMGVESALLVAAPIGWVAVPRRSRGRRRS